MADNNLDININARADKSEVEDLADAMNTLQEMDKDVEIGVNVNNAETIDEIEARIAELQAQIEEDYEWGFRATAHEAEEEVEALQAKLEELKESAESVDSSPIDEVSSSANDADEGLAGANESANNLSVSITNIDPSVLEQLGIAANEAGDGMEGASDNASSMFDAMASATIGAGMTAGLMSASQAAGNYQDTMVRLGHAMSGTSMSAEQAEQKYGSLISSMASETGRGAGAVRAHLLNMANAHITNEKVLSDSFEGISKASFQMGESMDSMEAKFQTMALTGMASKKALKSFGLTTEDLAKAMGVSADEVKDKFQSMDETTRASVLSAALNMRYGKDVNEDYKKSYQHLTEELDRAKEYLIRVVGEALLPTVIPAMTKAADIINGLAAAFKGLPEPIKQVIGGFGGLVLGASAVGLVLNGVSKIVGGAIAPFRQLYDYFRVVPDGENLTKFQQHLNTVKDKAGAAKEKLGALKTSIFEVGGKAKEAALSFISLGREVFASGLKALQGAAMWVAQKVALIATTTWSYITAGAEMALSVAQALLNVVMSLNPIVIVVLALIALAAAIIWAYQNVDQFRQFVDQLWQTIMQVFNSILAPITQFTSMLGINKGSWVNTLLAFIIFIATLPTQLAIIFANMIAKALGFGDNFVQRMFKAGSDSVSKFISYISSLPGKLSQELQNMLSTVSQWASTLPQKFWEAGVNAVKNFLNALGIHSPGFMQLALLGEMEDTGDRIPTASQNIIRNLENVGENAVKSFGNPKFDVGFDTDNIKSPNIDFSNGNLLESLLNTSDNKSGNVLNLTLNIGTVDKRERIEEIVEVIKNEIFWDNKTAGRTI